MLLSEYPRAPESKPRAPCWLILDGLSDVASQLAPLGYVETVLARPIQFSKNRPGPEGPRPLVHRSCSSCEQRRRVPDAHSPRLAGPDQPTFDRIQGNLLRLLQPFQTVNPHPAQSAEPRLRKRQSQSGRRCGLGGTFRPAVRPGSPETRELGDYERRRRNSILRAEEGLVNPGPGAYHLRKNCLTYGRSTPTQIPVENTRRRNACQIITERRPIAGATP